ncbi:MAG: hypothetical protein KZQ84_10750 [Candidatus Thiodiazotropha sp. (ex Lucinoma borealis)]|nr:hypothetical protein [Candidatus Thiodiazotropha sp. (ex Lucinoma borealis)]
MMNLQQHLLGKLAEEGTKVGQIALKTQQFGFDECCPNQPYSNTERTHQEIDDMMAIVEMLNDIGFGYSPSRAWIEAKKEKVVKYLQYSVGLGQVEHKALDEYEND